MNTRSRNLPLLDFDPEIEATCRRNNSQTTRAKLDTMATQKEVWALKEQLQRVFSRLQVFKARLGLPSPEMQMIPV